MNITAVNNKNITNNIVRAVNESAVAGTKDRILAMGRVSEDALSFTRNILCAHPAFGSAHPIVNNLGYYIGIASAFFSFRSLDRAVGDYQRSDQINDREGKSRSQAAIFCGTVSSAGSVAYLAGRVCDTVAAQAATAIAFKAAAGLFGAGTVVSIGLSLWGALRCARFQQKLSPYLHDPSQALQFLKDQVSVTPKEVQSFAEQIEKDHPEWSAEEKKEVLMRKVIARTEAKVKYMKRRTGNLSLYLIAHHAERLIAQLADPKTQAAAMREAKDLLKGVQKESQTKMLLYILGFIAALISLSALILATFFTVGIAPFVLYGVSGVLYLGMTSYSAAGTFVRQLPFVEAVQEPPMQDIQAS